MLKNYNKNVETLYLYKQFKFEDFYYNFYKYITANLVFKDMMFFTQTWRQIKGYSKNNQRTHSNNKNNKKTKLLNKYRLQQFYKLFGRKRRDIFPTLIIAEYTNRLWYLIWYNEWKNAWKFVVYVALKNRRIIKLDPYLLSKNIVTGVLSKKKKKKHNVAKKKLVLVVTIGLPILFSLYLYNYKDKYKLPYRVMITDEARKKMGKKKKNKKK